MFACRVSMPEALENATVNRTRRCLDEPHQSSLQGQKKRKTSGGDDEWRATNTTTDSEGTRGEGLPANNLIRLSNAEMVNCPEPSTSSFDTWKEFADYFHSYARATYQPFR